MRQALSKHGVPKIRHNLLAIAKRAMVFSDDGVMSVDAESADILADAVTEMGWRHDNVMPMVMKVALSEDFMPSGLRAQARLNWRLHRKVGFKLAQESWDIFKSSKSALWARAVCAALLFEKWKTPMRSTPRRQFETRSPWPLIRASVLKWNKAPVQPPPPPPFAQALSGVWIEED